MISKFKKFDFWLPENRLFLENFFSDTPQNRKIIVLVDFPKRITPAKSFPKEFIFYDTSQRRWMSLSGKKSLTTLHIIVVDGNGCSVVLWYYMYIYYVYTMYIPHINHTTLYPHSWFLQLPGNNYLGTIPTFPVPSTTWDEIFFYLLNL